MKNFSRALKEAWRHWPALVAALLCSLGVAALWGANIAALFPIIQTTLNGESLQSWNRQRLTAAQADLAAHEAELAPLEKRVAAAAPAERADLNVQLDVLRTRVRIDQASVYSAQRLQPFFDRYLPSEAFSTVVFIVALIAVATVAQAGAGDGQYNARRLRLAEHGPRCAEPGFQ